MSTKRIDMCLNAVKKRISENKVIKLQLEEGTLIEATFIFNPPPSDGEVEFFFLQNEWNAPFDYKYFLSKHNGALLFTHPKYSGGMEILSLENIKTISEDYGYMFPRYCYPIAMYNSAIVYIDSRVVESNSNCLYWQSCLDKNEKAMNLNMDFATFLDLFIVAQGSEFWLWPSMKAST